MDQIRPFFHQIHRGMHWLLPGQCLLCEGACTAALCDLCVDELPRLEHCCQTCALPLDITQARCGECLRHPPSFDATLCPFIYSGYLPTLINQFKHRRQLAIGRQLAGLLAQWLPAELTVDAVTPVPVHWLRLLQRGFNQAQLIAHPVAQTLAVPMIAAVGKNRLATHQQNLNRTQRLRSSRHSFYPKLSLSGCHVALVDDVITTGATAEAVAQCLRNAGATRITLIALARTPKR